MKIIVTGGAGFIGSALVRFLIEETNHIVLNIDKLTYAGNLESLNSIMSSERYIFKHADICNQNLMEEIISEFKPNAVMHLAAESHVDRSIDGPAEFISTNILGTYSLLEATKKYWNLLPEGMKTKFRFHHISTDEVYGDLPHPDDFKEAPRELPLFTEITRYDPSSPYSASKAASDHLVRAWYRTYGLPTIITNCSNNYGPYHNSEKLIPKIILHALNYKYIPIYGKGDQIRDWLYVEDHVRALYRVLTCGDIGDTYNIGGFNEIRNLDVALLICDIVDEVVPSDEGPRRDLIEYVTDRPGHDRRYAIDSTKLKNNLGWQPKETFASGIRKTIHWYINNQQWLDNSSQFPNDKKGK